eukprot:COSAG02_NODE_4540_length_5235_cov_4.163357_3_plen_86_part_00
MATCCNPFCCCLELLQAVVLDDVADWVSKLAKSTLTGLAMLDNKPVAAVSMTAATKSLVRCLVSIAGSASRSVQRIRVQSHDWPI